MTSNLKVTILGCGSSGGVPRITGDWGICDKNNPKNYRTRCSILVSQFNGETDETRVLVDTSPDMRAQLIAADAGWLDAVLYTHDHADQTHGIDDLRAIAYERRKKLPVWMDEATSKRLKARFGYCFEAPAGSGYPPILEEHRIESDHSAISIEGAGGVLTAKPFLQRHGPIDSLGFKFGNIAYSSDISELPDDSSDQIRGISLWIVDALRRDTHPTHFNLDQALEKIASLGVQRAILTNLHIDMDYETLCKELPAHIRPAYDGMVIKL